MPHLQHSTAQCAAKHHSAAAHFDHTIWLVDRYYSSGHDLGEQARAMAKLLAEGADMEQALARRINEQAHTMITAVIEFSKPLLVAVNGPAFGVSVTCLQLADIVYAADTASFTTPFMKYGFCAEGCSSLLFPEVLGPSKANEMLLLGRTLSVQEAERCGFIASVFPEAELLGEVMSRAHQMASFPPQALRDTKKIGRRDKRMAQLLETNDAELELLVQRFMSEESSNAVAKFMQEQQAKKKQAKL